MQPEKGVTFDPCQQSTGFVRIYETQQTLIYPVNIKDTNLTSDLNIYSINYNYTFYYCNITITINN